ncbi:Na+:H+ antiporter, NhaC family [Actinobaculum suis]|uniref:Na+/H+ antiporter NhaC n=1 Tax=Actinobaculum suis TaxID=1657 RepID=A0A1G7EQC5_9ACTO|nr:Na+/H+ antiporter NhaC [Actinobaculum suis]MDY5152849.1 Na+/H+ antiporter NhaC [Actinobaculum suis]SDE65883.1 Na+:H+ antiporter, NhaC family [Actinobaculum suis]
MAHKKNRETAENPAGTPPAQNRTGKGATVTGSANSANSTGTASKVAKPRKKRELNVFLALLPVLALVLFIGGGYIGFDLPVEPMIISAAAVAAVVAWYLGYSWDDMMDSVSEKMAKAWPALLILLTVGILIGSWMAGGTIPYLVYWGLKLIDPRWLALIALIGTAIVSLCTGTSWGSAGTIGVAFMGIAIGMDVNLAMVAGAVVSGAYFGDKMSPLSDTTNITAMITRVPLFTHVKNMLWTTGAAFVLAAVVFGVAGFMSHDVDGDISGVEAITSELSTIFNFNLWMLVPAIVVLIGAGMQLPTIPVMLLGTVLGLINAFVFQGVHIKDAFTTLVSGFKLDMITASGWDPDTASESMQTLLERGGMNSMLGTLAICFCAIAFAGIMGVSKSLDYLVERVLSGVKTRFGLVSSTIGIGLGTIAVTCNGQISLIMPGDVLRPAYVRRGVHPKVLGRTLEDSVTVTETLFPWTAAGAYMAATLGVPTLEYVPWAVLNWSGMIFALILAATGLGIYNLSREEQVERLEQEDLTEVDVIRWGNGTPGPAAKKTLTAGTQTASRESQGPRTSASTNSTE